MDLTTNAIIAPLTAPAASLRPYAGPTTRPQIIPGPQVQGAKHTWLTAAGFAGTAMSAVANAGCPPRGVLQ